jgi:outer membrane protein assembly factor BamB
MPRFTRLALRLCILGLCQVLSAADQPHWGQRDSRNMISEEKNLPDRFDPTTRQNLKWSARLGSETHGTPVIAGGKVFVGTNNDHPRDLKHQGDRGVLMCFSESDGKLLWQLVVPKLEDDRFLDWPKSGIASAPTVEGNRAYVLTNRAEVVCLDLDGMANGNDGPYQDEARHMTPRGQPLLELGPLDADIIWLYDLVSQSGTHPHDQTHASILIDGGLLYLNTCNGVDNTHRRIRKPEAPSLIVIDKSTGRSVAADGLKIGHRIFHNTWSSPSRGIVNGKPLIFFNGGDAICYAFEPVSQPVIQDEMATLKEHFRFDFDPTAPKEEVHRWTGNRRQGPSILYAMPVFQEGKIYLAGGGDMWWGKQNGWLKCIDASGKGDITSSAEIWSYPMKQTCSTPAIINDLVFAADCGGNIHCVDRKTGQAHWTHQVQGEIWASPMVADGKVYIGTRRGQFLVFAADSAKRLLSSIDLKTPISATAIPANGMLYIASMTDLYALQSQR